MYEQKMLPSPNVSFSAGNVYNYSGVMSREKKEFFLQQFSGKVLIIMRGSAKCRGAETLSLSFVTFHQGAAHWRMHTESFVVKGGQIFP